MRREWLVPGCMTVIAIASAVDGEPLKAAADAVVVLVASAALIMLSPSRDSTLRRNAAMLGGACLVLGATLLALALVGERSGQPTAGVIGVAVVGFGMLLLGMAASREPLARTTSEL